MKNRYHTFSEGLTLKLGKNGNIVIWILGY